MSKKQVAFLFGAGAEGKGNFNLPSGIDFMRDSYLNKDLYNKQTKYLKTLFDKEYFIKDNDDGVNAYKYTAYNYADNNTLRAIMKKWIFNQFYHQDISNKHKRQLYSFLSKDDLQDLFEKDFDSDLHSQIESNSEYFDMFKKLLHCKELTKSDVDVVKDTFLECFLDSLQFKKELPTGISFVLDQHFHTIIDPQRFGINNFSKVFNYYWAIFISIYLPIIKLLEVNDSKDLTYKLALDNLQDYIKKLYIDTKTWDMVKDKAMDTYYHHINETFNAKDSNIEVSGVITSNYYKFIELIETKDNKYAYLNGQLKLFEVPETLEVIDITVTPLPEDKLYFPFIFGQSYIKPIVSKYQIEAFSTMEDILNNSDILVVLGYNINEDDNHINSFIRSFVKQDSKYIIIVSNSNNKAEIESKLKLKDCDNLIMLEVNYPDGAKKITHQIKERLET